MTKIEPGNIYFASKEKFFSKQVHKKKKITCTIIKIDSNIFGLKYFNDNFLVTSKNAQKNRSICKVIDSSNQKFNYIVRSNYSNFISEY